MTSTRRAPRLPPASLDALEPEDVQEFPVIVLPVIIHPSVSVEHYGPAWQAHASGALPPANIPSSLSKATSSRQNHHAFVKTPKELRSRGTADRNVVRGFRDRDALMDQRCPGETCKRAERSLRSVQAKPKVLVGERGEQVGRLVPMRIPPGPDLAAPLVL